MRKNLKHKGLQSIFNKLNQDYLRASAKTYMPVSGKNKGKRVQNKKGLPYIDAQINKIKNNYKKQFKSDISSIMGPMDIGNASPAQRKAHKKYMQLLMKRAVVSSDANVLKDAIDMIIKADKKKNLTANQIAQLKSDISGSGKRGVDKGLIETSKMYSQPFVRGAEFTELYDHGLFLFTEEDLNGFSEIMHQANSSPGLRRMLNGEGGILPIDPETGELNIAALIDGSATDQLGRLEKIINNNKKIDFDNLSDSQFQDLYEAVYGYTSDTDGSYDDKIAEAAYDRLMKSFLRNQRQSMRP